MAKRSDILPKVVKTVSKLNSTQVLYTLLVMASFLIGYFFAKVQYLEKNAGTTPSTGTQAQVPSQGTQPNAPQAPNPGQKVNVDIGHLPIKGNQSAKVTVIEFADFRCPFCERLYKDAIKNIIKDYVDSGKVKLAYRHFAFLGPASTTAANAAECANEQGKFWEYHDYLFDHQPSESDTSMYVTDKLTSIAAELGLNSSQFKTCLDSTKFAKNVTDDQTAGQTAGVSGTPSTFVNGMILVGAQPYSAFKDLIDKELAK